MAEKEIHHHHGNSGGGDGGATGMVAGIVVVALLLIGGFFFWSYSGRNDVAKGPSVTVTTPAPTTGQGGGAPKPGAK
jgi:hypothetical protein